MGLNKVEHKIYASILSSDGKIRVQCKEGDEGAVRREYETSDGEKGVKFEQVYDNLDGKITGIEFKDGEFGKQIIVEIAGVSLAMSTASNFGEDFMKKLPMINLEQEVALFPYSFNSKDTGKNVKGITVYQADNKLPNFFWDYEENTSCNGYPVPEGDTKKYDSDDWKMYYMTARKFLIKYTEDNIIAKMALEDLPPMAGETVVTAEEEDIAF